jgi:hypothetical protein
VNSIEITGVDSVFDKKQNNIKDKKYVYNN